MAVSEPKVVDESGGKHDLQLFIDTWLRYIELSKYLFASDEPIYDINEMPSKSKFYKAARNIADQLEVDWKTMSHEDSNRIMLALLEDTYKAMAAVESEHKSSLVVEINLKIKANDKSNKKKA